ncbi:MAG TPA: ABC transporter ATP-binding protein [Paenibacillus sp.]|nr:ABC transporter ATP-binding protein [Paenibacillus sp.]
MRPVVEVEQAEKAYRVGDRTVRVLQGVELTLVPGELVMLRGRSGSGKTTLLNLIGGLDEPTGGDVRFGGASLRGLGDAARTALRRSRIGIVFQSAALLPQLSARENVELSLRLAGTPRRDWRERTEEALELVGLARRAAHRPYELSGGERQRAAIAKAIAHRPELLLADEPTAELDSQLSVRMAALFRRLAREEGLAICMTTHDETIMEVADRVYDMADGRLVRRTEAAKDDAAAEGAGG